MSFIKNFVCCDCPPPPMTEADYRLPPWRRSPLDGCGFKAKCCGCVPLNVAVVIIGVITLMWAVMQLQSADNVFADIIPDKTSDLFYYTKLAYIFLALLLLLACGVLFLSVVVPKYILVNVFVWYAFIFNCISIALFITAFGLRVVRTAKVSARQIIKFVMALLWYCLYFYFLQIVNSHKIMLFL